MLASFGTSEAAFKPPFSRQTEENLRALALEDRHGTIDAGSCLEPMVKGRQVAWVGATDLEREIIFLKWGNNTDATLCSEGYQVPGCNDGCDIRRCAC